MSIVFLKKLEIFYKKSLNRLQFVKYLNSVIPFTNNFPNIDIASNFGIILIAYLQRPVLCKDRKKVDYVNKTFEYACP